MNKILLTFIISLGLINSTFANPNIDARTGILMDFHSEEVLYMNLMQTLKFILHQ